MVDAGLAKAMRVTRTDAQCLLNGHVCESVAEALGVAAFQIQSWIDHGTVEGGFMDRLGMDAEAANQFGIQLTRKGRLGVVFGMLIEH